jgi:hypothetical protein
MRRPPDEEVFRFVTDEIRDIDIHLLVDPAGHPFCLCLE